ncbi:polymorphic toxin-type HINT domain-containing protein [Actinacidiphila glaucinigra]|uniref:polymorphic toxin-type HINT domain-containing protein n=1 Tax=Actinacidiphila glaucinigra TaxID=235986 RepID=UPI0033A93AEC
MLGAPGATAAEPATLPPNVRAEIVGYWETGGAGLKEAAEQALLGGDEGIQKFLEEAESIQYDDNRVETARLVMTGGPGMRLAAKEAMLESPADLETFLLYGYEEPLDEDRKVEIARLITLGGAGVQAAGKAALQGTFEDRELFLTTGQYTERQDDNRVEVARLATAGGPNVKTAARVALRGSPEEMVEFLELGQFIARDRDQETATIAQLIEQAKLAGIQAEDSRKAAEESSAKAVEASKLAKEAAQKAAAETAAAKDDSHKAAIKAKQAADAARGAADAAQEAIGAANAANRAARRAALAAAQTASAAAAASEAANKAYKAAIAAAHDKANAGAANQAASQARAAAEAAATSAVAAENAGLASDAAAVASEAAKGASSNARAAADAADEANASADAAGVHSNEARVAAAEARRHASAADAAADRSADLARRAATAAYGARDAARSAAGHANKSANYADEAAEHAGDAATYAAVAKKNAEAAKAAASSATAAVNKAKDIFDLARETEAADLKTRTDAAIERARSMKSASEAAVSASATTQVEALSLNDTATALAEEAGRPDVDIQATAAKGRQLAMQALKLLGPWHQEAAARALSGTDQDVLDYLRTRWKEANGNDTRERVVDLSDQSPYASVRTAAAEALTGTPEQIQAFYSSGQYQAGRDDMKVDVARLAETGGTGVSDAAKAALADGNGTTLARFLRIGQYGERLSDERVITAHLAETGGAELQAAAKIALAGPPELIHEFVSTGQYTAQRKDDLTATHIHQVQRLLAEGALIAARAQENAWYAAEASATAQNAAEEAAAAAAEAKKSADQAKEYAEDAKASADAATQSAADAAASATTARNAATAAAQDATAAENSAADAEFSASYARSSAQRADKSADQARASAIAAGKSAAEAEAEAKQAWTATRDLVEKEKEEILRQIQEEREAQTPDVFCFDLLPFDHSALPINTIVCDDGAIDTAVELAKDPRTYEKIIWELSGLADIERCIDNPTALDCTMAVAGLVPWGKLKYAAKLGKGIEFLKSGRAVRRTVSCLTKAANSFPAGTKVLMADGTRSPIEHVKTGDLVIAADPITGITGPRRVTNTIHTPDDRSFTDVTLTDGSTLTSTSHHPYWSVRDLRWKDANTLTAGDTLRTAQNTAAVVAHTRDWQGLQDAYNLTVDDLHTYYVSIGATDVLVHNTDYVCPKWVQLAWDKLPIRKYDGDPTTGYVFTPDGQPIWESPIQSGRSTLSEEINAFLKTSKDFEADFSTYATVSHHAEVKLAWEMRKNMGKGELHIVINNNYVCPKVNTRNAMGCKQAVPAILYDDQIIWVHVPGLPKPIPLEGVAKRSEGK